MDKAAVVLGVVLLAACGPKDKCDVTPHCLKGDFCLDGTCVDVDEAGRCTPTVEGPDGCDYESMCRNAAGADQLPEFRCEEVRMGCIGDAYFVNDDHWPEKDNDLCLEGACTSSGECPGEGERCLLIEDAALGLCSDGARYSLCLVDADCPTNACVLLGEDTAYGVCGGQSQ